MIISHGVELAVLIIGGFRIMHPRQFAFYGGLFLLIFGLMAFFPALSPLPDHGLTPLDVNASYGAFLRIFPMNIFNKFFLAILGASGWIASSMEYTELPHSIHFSRTVFWTMAPLALLGLTPGAQTLFGFCPLYGPMVAFHAIFAAFGAYHGYVMPIRASHHPIVRSAHPIKFV